MNIIVFTASIGDLPPDYFTLNQTLGSTDGAGEEIRFAFTTTLAPEMDWMENEPHFPCRRVTEKR